VEGQAPRQGTLGRSLEVMARKRSRAAAASHGCAGAKAAAAAQRSSGGSSSRSASSGGAAAASSVPRTGSAGSNAAKRKKEWLARLGGAPHNSHVLLLDLDNWPTFFCDMPWATVPGKVFIGACYRQETFERAAQRHQLQGRTAQALYDGGGLLWVPSLASKDSADSNLISLAKDVERVVESREALSRLWVTIVSGDHIFKQTQETLARTLPCMRCAERDYMRLATLLTATGTCCAGQLRIASAVKNDNDVTDNRRLQKRARLVKRNTVAHSKSASVAAVVEPEPPKEIATERTSDVAVSFGNGSAISALHFNIGSKGSSNVKPVGGAQPGCRRRNRHHRGKNSRQQPNNSRTTTLAELCTSSFNARAVSSSKSKSRHCVETQDATDNNFKSQWPALPPPSPVKLTFAQALANSSSKQATAKTSNLNTSEVFRFGQNMRA
jgi:hypothetical protein